MSLINNTISIQIVTFNNQDCIKNCVLSILEQTFKGQIVRIIDNSSHDKTRQCIDYDQLGIEVICNSNNRGFAAAHNQGFRLASSKYILVLNPDVILSPTFIEQLIEHLELNPEVGAACGKLLRYGEDNKPTDIIDSTGLMIFKNRRVIDRGQGEVDRGQYDQMEYIFGCSGAAVIYRREMLEDIKIDNEYFDEEFFAYKEDVDLAWRAQLKGWKSAYIPTAVAYHGRGWQPGKRSKVPRFIQIHSFQNRYLMLLKNEELANLLYNLPQILLFEIMAVIYLLFRAPYLFRCWSNLLKLIKPTLEKRGRIMETKKTMAGDLRKWFK